MDSSETADALNSAVQRIVTPGEPSTSQPVNDEPDDEHTPLLAAQHAEAGGGGVYSTPRELLESSLYSSRSWRNTSSYIARVSYYSRLNGSARTGAFNVPPHIMAQYLVIPSSLGYKQGGKQSSIVTIFAIWNTMMGTSMLSMSWGLQQSGFLLGLVLIIGLGMITFYTANRVLRSQYHVPRNVVVFEFGDIAKHFLGRWAELMAGIFGLLSFVGALLAYWTLMSTFLLNIGDFIHQQITTDNKILPITNATICTNPSINEGFGVSESNSTSTFEKLWNAKTVPLYLVLILLPILNLKDAVVFTKFNSLGTISVFYITCLTITKAAIWGINFNIKDDTSIHYVELASVNFPSLMGMLCLAFYIHNAVITLLKNNEKQENNTRDLAIGYSLVAFTYAFIGGLFFLTFPQPKACIDQNFIKNLETNDLMAVIARFFLFFQMSTVFPLLIFIFRTQLLYTIFKMSEYPGLLKCVAINGCVVAICALVAIVYPQVGNIIGWSGAVCGLVYIFLLPCLVSIAIRKKRKTIKTSFYITQGLLIALGFFVLIAKIVAAFIPVHT